MHLTTVLVIPGEVLGERLIGAGRVESNGRGVDHNGYDVCDACIPFQTRKINNKFADRISRIVLSEIVCARAPCVRACVRACVHACVHACVRACVKATLWCMRMAYIQATDAFTAEPLRDSPPPSEWPLIESSETGRVLGIRVYGLRLRVEGLPPPSEWPVITSSEPGRRRGFTVCWM